MSLSVLGSLTVQTVVRGHRFLLLRPLISEAHTLNAGYSAAGSAWSVCVEGEGGVWQQLQAVLAEGAAGRSALRTEFEGRVGSGSLPPPPTHTHTPRERAKTNTTDYSFPVLLFPKWLFCVCLLTTPTPPSPVATPIHAQNNDTWIWH